MAEGQTRGSRKHNLLTPPGCLPGESAKECRERRKKLKPRAMTHRQLKKQKEKEGS